MEKRAILAAVLMAGVLMLYQALFLTSPEQPPPPPKTREGTPTAPTGSAPPGIATAVPVPVPPPPAGPAPAVPERMAEIETPLYRARVSSAGGALQQWDLEYRGEKPMVLKGVVYPVGLTVVRPGAAPLVIPFTMSTDSLRLGKERPQAELHLVGEDGFGLRVTQILGFRADGYLVTRDIKVENRHQVAQSAELALSWTAPSEWPKEHEGFRGPRPISVVRLGNGAFWARRVWVRDAEPFLGDGRWIGFEGGVAPTGQNGVYLTALIPMSPGMKLVEARGDEGGGGSEKAAKKVQIGVRVPLPVLQPGQDWNGRVLSYLGPMEYDRLKALGVDLEKAIYFGGFPFAEAWAERSGVPTLPMEWIAVAVLRLMHWFYGFVGNYGIAIILLTVISKVVFFPLSLKSMRSMKAMQAIQPQVNALRAKYKNDAQRVQREMMELYRQHKVNPLGGCLPMLVQVPIFYALYVALSVSADLQNSPFVCFGKVPSWVPFLGGSDFWICDLAAQDPTYVLPILMGVSMFIQQKMTPVMGDPRQAKIMLMMPVVFTFMFLSLPAGLVLYWTLSNVLQIAQQYYMDRGAKKAERVPARAPKKA
jgi:YidC/Oxa1 family membrane protein insertase